MPTFYLFDAHTSPINDSPLLDTVVRAEDIGTGLFDFTGAFTVRVDDGVQIDDAFVTDLPDVLTEKYAGILATFPGFTRITFDDFLDATNVDTAASSGIRVGERSNIFLKASGTLQSLATPLTGGAPADAIIIWELFAQDSTVLAAVGERGIRRYVQLDPSDVDVTVSFDGGTSFNPATHGALLSVPLADQGTSFVFSATPPSDDVFIASWAVIY